jgi:hypothetical protein
VSRRRRGLTDEGRRLALQPRQIFITFIVSCALGLGCLFLFIGCGDDSKTTGTQLQMSPEVKAELEDMKSVMKEERAARKLERAGLKKK